MESNTPLSKKRFISGALLVAGTCIGAGMLGLPVVTGPSGLLPTFFINLLCWTVMLLTGLLFLEAAFWFKEGANMISIANGLLGPVGKWISGLAFIFLYYCLMVAYVAGGAPLLQYFLSPVLTSTSSILLFSLIFAILVFCGPQFVGRVNSFLMIGLVLFYLLLLTGGASEIDFSRYTFSNWGLSFLAAPTLFSAYGFHNVVPTLTTYLHRNKRKSRHALLVGTGLSFLIFTLWQWMIIGAVPKELILEAGKQGIPITQVIQELSHNPMITLFSSGFAFFAIVTSVLGVGLSMVDFLGDWFSWERKGVRRALLSAIIFIPPTLIALLNPGIFMGALGVAGGIGEAILNGLIPIAMVFVGIFWLKKSTHAPFYTKKPVLASLLIVTLVIMGIEIAHLLGV